MATIRPSSDLRNKYHEPVFITKNDTGDLVVLSNAECERLSGKYELRRLLDEGLASMQKGTGLPAEEVFADLERNFYFDRI